MQRANTKTPNANPLSQIDKCSPPQQCAAPVQCGQPTNGEPHRQSLRSSKRCRAVKRPAVANGSGQPAEKTSTCGDSKSQNNGADKSYSNGCRETKERNLNRDLRDSGQSSGDSRDDEERQLNNNSLDRKNANYSDLTPLYGRSTGSPGSEASSGEPCTPIYLHHPPSFGAANGDQVPVRLVRHRNAVKTNNQTNATIEQNESNQRLSAGSRQQRTDQYNGNQRAAGDQQSGHSSHLQLSQDAETAAQLYEISVAEQRLELKSKARSPRLTSRLSSASSSTDSNAEDERLNKDLPYPEYVRYSFNWLPQESEWRQICLRMIANPWFERVSMTAILLNCITLGMYHPCADEICLRPKCKMLQMFDDVIFAFFTVEMMIKMTAMGVRGTKGAYLSHPWNRLDFFIVISGYVFFKLIGITIHHSFECL